MEGKVIGFFSIFTRQTGKEGDHWSASRSPPTLLPIT